MNKINRGVYKILVFTIITISAGLYIKTNLIGFYFIPTASMSPTLIPGDVIFVAKTFTLQKKMEVKLGGVYIFKFPYLKDNNTITILNSSNNILIKRLVALPGDTFLIKKGIYYTNNQIINLLLKNEKRKVILANSRPSVRIFPHDTLCFRWSIEEFGPIQIPQRGLSITLNEKNISLYKSVILNENPNMIGKDSILFSKRCGVLKYVFKKDYYFMCGDNPRNSYDSRYWGFISEEDLLGEAVFILLSINSNEKWHSKFRWDRLMDRIK